MQLPHVRLAGILKTEQLIVSNSGLLGALQRKLLQQNFAAANIVQRRRQSHIALIPQCVHRKNPTGPAGIARHKNQFVLCRTVIGPFKVVFDLGWFVVLVDTKDTSVEVVSRVFEIIRVATEERDRGLRRPYQPHVGKFFVLVKVILTTAVQRYDI